MSEVRFTDQHEWVRVDGDEATVGGEGRRKAVPVGRDSPGCSAHAFDAAGQPVADVDARSPVRIPRYEISGIAREGHEAIAEDPLAGAGGNDLAHYTH